MFCTDCSKWAIIIAASRCVFAHKWSRLRVWLPRKHPRLQPAQLPHTLAHSHPPPDLSTPPSAGVRRQREALLSLSFCSVWLQGDSGYKSKNTNSDPQEGAFAIHCSTSRVFFFKCAAFFFFLIHKAAACKWGKTSPKSWRSKRRAAQQLQQRGGSAGTEGRSLRVVSADLTGKYAERWSVLPGLCWRGSKSCAGAFEKD